MASIGFALLVLAAVLGYTYLLNYYRQYWNIIPAQDAEISGIESVSVVIAARNEGDNIRDCLEAIAGQKVGDIKIQCIVVDDHSTDNTAEVVKSFPDVELLDLGEADSGNGKKAALTAGIRVSSGDIVILTDGDCTMGEDWLNSMLKYFDDHVDLVTGPVCYRNGTGLLHRFQVLDVLGLMQVTGGGIQSHLHHLANGANLAFRRMVFHQVGGYADNAEFASGDDLFLIQAVAVKDPTSVAYAKSPEAIVWSHPETSWGGLIQQRLRWASKNFALRERRIQLIWAGIWVAHLFLLVALITIPVMPWPAITVVLVALFIKMIADFRFLNQGWKFAYPGPLRGFVAAFVVQLIYVLYIGILSLMTSRYEWKGRSVR